MSTVVPTDDNDDGFSDDNNDNGSLVIFNLEVLHKEMSCFESSFFDTLEHPSNPDNELMILLDIQHPITDNDKTRNNTEVIPPDDDDNPDLFDDILPN